MELHEYQAKNILKEYGVDIPDFFIASTIKEVEEHVIQKKITQAVVKGQVHAGGRKKAGAVKIARTPDETYSKNPEKVDVISIFSYPPLHDFQIRRVLSFMGWSMDNKDARRIIEGMVKAFFLNDATLLEINPLVETMEGKLVLLDAKMS